MKLNDIKFLPNANAFSDVYDKATGMPFVGEMMVAAAGQESEPTPDPEPDPEPTQLIMDENYENYIGDICDGGNWTAHTSYNGTDFQDQSGTYEKPSDCPADCNNWEDMEYSSYWDCECNENDHCVDCENDWESEGFESYEDCECQANGNCGEEEPEEEPVE